MTKEIKRAFDKLIEKFIINGQDDKAKLIQALFNRLITIFTNKAIDTEILYNILHIILTLTYSPLNNFIDIELLKERFEERYYKTETNKIMRNINYDLKDIMLVKLVRLLLNFIRIKKFMKKMMKV